MRFIYNGPVLLAFFVLLLGIAIPGGHFQNSVGARRARLFVCAAICGWVTLIAIPRYSDLRTGRVVFESERGTIYIRETTLPAWADAVNFMRKAKQDGEAVMSYSRGYGSILLRGCAIADSGIILYTGYAVTGAHDR